MEAPQQRTEHGHALEGHRAVVLPPPRSMDHAPALSTMTRALALRSSGRSWPR